MAERGKMACRLASISAASQQAAGGEPVPNPRTVGRYCRASGSIAGSLPHPRDSPGTSARSSLKKPSKEKLEKTQQGKAVKTIKSGVWRGGEVGLPAYLQ